MLLETVFLFLISFYRTKIECTLSAHSQCQNVCYITLSFLFIYFFGQTDLLLLCFCPKVVVWTILFVL